MIMSSWNKIKWTVEMDKFLLENYNSMTNKELADAIGLRLTTTRTRLIHLGLKRMEMEYWTHEQIEFLKANYKLMGDTEIAELFQNNYSKVKGWNKKHIEKKRRYLKLKRTEVDKKLIHERNREAGRFAMCPVKAWETRGQAPVGEVRVWDMNGSHYPTKYIKTENGWVKLSHFNWIKINGAIPAGAIITHLDGNAMNCETDNLASISKSENMARNGGSKDLSDNYVAGLLTPGDKELREELKKLLELIEVKRQSIKLNRIIKNEYDRKIAEHGR
jgi:hypothetical protein